MIEGLSRFSIGFAEALFASFPWLEEHAKVDPHPRVDPGSLLIVYAPPPVREDCQLWISTDSEEVTIGFGMLHAHFAWPVPVEDEWRDDPLDFLRGILDDRILVQDRTRNGKWIGSTTLDQGSEPEIANWSPGDVVHIRSWSGARDLTIRPPAEA